VCIYTYIGQSKCVYALEECYRLIQELSKFDEEDDNSGNGNNSSSSYEEDDNDEEEDQSNYNI
jgi:hypothetical protein